MPEIIKGIEIFRVGTWNKDTYTRADLDDMVANFDKVGFAAPLKLGHQEVSGGPAYGWVSRIYRIGDKLIADFKDLPAKLFDAIKARRFDQISAEIFWDLERNGRKFRRVLKAVALLGGEIPAVSGLAPLRTVINSIPENGFNRVGAYVFKMGNPNMETLTSPSEEIDRLAREFTFNHPTITYREAVARIRAMHPNLVAAYAVENNGAVRVYNADADSGDPSRELHEKTLDLMQSETCLAYSAAAARVIRENRGLAGRWARFASAGSETQRR